MDVGFYLVFIWNNLEFEVVFFVILIGWIIGVILGNDVNLWDVEGCLVFLLFKVKDNNVFVVIGLMICLFDLDFLLDDVCVVELMLIVIGLDGFEMIGYFLMKEIS